MQFEIKTTTTTRILLLIEMSFINQLYVTSLCFARTNVDKTFILRRFPLTD